MLTISNNSLRRVQTLSSTPGRTCAVGKGGCVRDDVVLHLRTGERTERLSPITEMSIGDRYYPIGPETLLATHSGGKSQKKTLSLIDLPQYRETAEVTHAIQPPQSRPIVDGLSLSTDYGFVISYDRRMLTYAFDDVLVCRDTDNLAVLWTRYIEPERRPYDLAISAHRTRVAAAIGGDISHRVHAPFFCLRR